MRWLLDRLALSPRDRMLDCGSGVGGPSAFTRAETGIVPTLTDPEYGACKPGGAVHRSRPRRLLAELVRVLRPAGRLGLLVFVAAGPLPEQPEGNNFPTPELRRRYGSDPRWQTAADQADIMGRLLADGGVTGELLVTRRGA